MWSPPKEAFEKIQDVKKKNATFIAKERMIQEVMSEFFMYDVGNELKRLYQNVMKNFKYLLSAHDISRNYFQNDVEHRFGITFPKQMFTKQKASRLKSIFLVAIIAHYFGVSVFEMVYTDLSKK